VTIVVECRYNGTSGLSVYVLMCSKSKTIEPKVTERVIHDDL